MDANKKLAGKVAPVTGAGRGLGRAYALRLARLGADVVVNDIRFDVHREYNEELTADSVADEVAALGVRSLGIEADVTRKDQVDAMVAQVEQAFGRIDILAQLRWAAIARAARSLVATTTGQSQPPKRRSARRWTSTPWA
jgi:NAD(P)-dependent dehydrogenase (short-subunit alcohol dehydrogenase family)